MRRDRYHPLVALSLALAALPLLQGCPAVIGAGSAVAVSTLEDRRTSGTQLEDATIESRAASRISERFGERAHINVAAFNRTVLITGEAWDEATRGEIEKVVAAVPNVRGILNEVQVAGISSTTSRANDTALTARVKGRLLNAKGINFVHVKVITEASVVYLQGLVTEAEAETAVEVARTTTGVRRVVKTFEYCTVADELCKPPAPPADKPKPPRA
jgi:osmotically-inducible protein OsmY